MAAKSNSITSFPKSRRLLKRERFLSMNGPGQRRLRTAAFLVIAKPNSLAINRFGVTVTRKTGKAVVRNRFKRVAREFFRLNQADWPQGFDLLFIALKGYDAYHKDLLKGSRVRIHSFLIAEARKTKTQNQLGPVGPRLAADPQKLP